MLKKSLFMSLVLVLVVIAGITGCTGSETKTTTMTTSATITTTTTAVQEVINIKWATFSPIESTPGVVMHAFADELEAATNGRVKVTFYDSESLVGMADMFDATVAGTCDFAAMDPTIAPGRFPVSSVIALPQLFDTAEQASQASFALYDKFQEFQDEFAGVKILYFNTIDVAQCLHTSTKQIKSIEDMAGQIITHSATMGVDTLEALGASPVAMPPSERFTSLERGVIDGVLTGYEGCFAFGLNQVTKYRTENVNITPCIMPIIYSEAWYNGLPDDIKKIFDELADGIRWSKEAGAAFDGAEAQMKAEVLKSDEEAGNPAPYALTDAQRQEWLDIVSPVRDKWAEEMEADGLPGQDLLDEAVALAKQYK